MYRQRLEAIVARCRTQKTLLVLLTQPALYGDAVDPVTGVDLRWVQVDSERELHGGLAWRILEQYNDVVRAVGQEQGVPMIDLARTVPKSSALYLDFVHFSDAGAQTIANAPARSLCPLLAEPFRGIQQVDCLDADSRTP